jgi:hypothetical protein
LAHRTGIRKRLSYDKIEYEAEGKICGHENDGQEGPKPVAHAAALSVSIDVSNQKNQRA